LDGWVGGLGWRVGWHGWLDGCVVGFVRAPNCCLQQVLAGEKLPADGLVVQGTGQVDESMLTGTTAQQLLLPSLQEIS